MTANHNIGDPAELAALFVSGAMSAETLREFEAHLDTGCGLCNQEVRALEPVLAALTDAPSVRPPNHVRAALLKRVGAAETAVQSRGAGDGASAGDHVGGHGVDPQVWRKWASDSASGGTYVQRGEEAAWSGVGIDGIQIRKMFVDRSRNQLTMLVRMAAGTAYPRHVHDGPEECYVLEGDLRVGEDTLHAGDFQRCEPGSMHPVQSTDHGCLLLIVSSLSDELVD